METLQLIPTEVEDEEKGKSEGKRGVSGQWGGAGKGTSLGVVGRARCHPCGHQDPHRPLKLWGQSLQGWRGTGGARGLSPRPVTWRVKGTTKDFAVMSSLGQCCPGASGPDITGTPKNGHSSGDKGPPRRLQREQQGMGQILSRSFVLREQRPGALPAHGQHAAAGNSRAVSHPGRGRETQTCIKSYLKLKSASDSNTQISEQRTQMHNLKSRY